MWNKTILDGHNRYNLLKKHSFIEYEIKEMEFSSRQEALIWICNHQLGRRNLTPERRKYLIGKRYEAEKQISQNRGNQYTSVKKDATDQNDPCQNKSGSHITRQRIANETGTSEGYMQRAEKYMNGVEAADEAAPGAREEILNGQIKAADREICAIAKALSFSFDGDSSTTAIENVAGQEDATVQTDEFVYNLSGQRVGTRNNMSNLSSGIYVVAGKKFVVK